MAEEQVVEQVVVEEKDLKPTEDIGLHGLIGLRVFDLPENIPEEAKTILALKCYGLSNAEVARRLRVTEGAVRYHIKQYDLNNITEKGSLIRKLLISAMFESVAMECISSIKREDISKLGAKDKIQLANTCVKAIESLQIKQYEPPKKTDTDIMKALSDGNSITTP